MEYEKLFSQGKPAAGAIPHAEFFPRARKRTNKNNARPVSLIFLSLESGSARLFLMNMRKSQKFFYSCLAFLAGVALAEIFGWPETVISAVAVAVSGAAIFFLPFRFRAAAVISLFFMLGMFWSQFRQPVIDAGHIAFYNGQAMSFEASVSDEPERKTIEQRVVIRPVNFAGNVLVKTALEPTLIYGDLLKIDCRLEKTASKDLPKYEKYLAADSIYSVCFQPAIRVIGKNRGNLLTQNLLAFKNHALARLNKTISEPRAALLAGILIGSRAGLPIDLRDQFNATGLSHIMAISGYNITLFVAVLMNFFIFCGIGRRRAFWPITIGLFLFVAITGFSPSVIRAGIMGFLVLLAGKIGRRAKMDNVLIFSAGAMVLVNPKILLWDVGFQLSFLSIIGLIYLAPKIQPYLSRLPRFFSLRENAASTISAIIFTLPLSFFSFGAASLVGLIANLLVIPAVPIVMAVGFAQIIGALVWIPIGLAVGWLNWFVLGYVIEVVRVLSYFPLARIAAELAVWQLLAGYAVLLTITLKKGKIKAV